MRPPRQEQLTWPWWVSRHRSWQPSLLMRQGESSPEAGTGGGGLECTDGMRTHSPSFPELPALAVAGVWWWAGWGVWGA